MDEIEDETKYDFFSRIPADVQEIIEKNKDRLTLTASLFADPLGKKILPLDSFSTLGNDTAIWQYGVGQTGSSEVGSYGTSQINSFQSSVFKVGTSQNSLSKISTIKGSLNEHRISQISRYERSSIKTNFSEAPAT